MVAKKVVKEKKKRSRHFRPGTVAKRNIKKAQRKCTNNISKAEIDRVIQRAQQKTSYVQQTGKVCRMQPGAKDIIHEMTEAYIYDVMRIAYKKTLDDGRKQLAVKDVMFVLENCNL